MANKQFDALVLKLESAGIPKDYYSLGHERNERTCLVQSDQEWLVYYSERGRKEGMHKFSSLEDASQFLIAILINT